MPHLYRSVCYALILVALSVVLPAQSVFSQDDEFQEGKLPSGEEVVYDDDPDGKKFYYDRKEYKPADTLGRYRAEFGSPVIEEEFKERMGLEGDSSSSSALTSD
ncbi:MAG: hypothetical protein KDD70_12520, partial [Bdellovibrionales bacterium]|nr:hypothetical protein [Bdellovibrionales bacterium]